VFAGYGAAQALSSDMAREKLSLVASCLGLVFSFAWFCVNRGSKQWQENWEFHTDLLENEVVGPLYKVVIKNTPQKGVLPRMKYLIVGAGNFSVTKINQIVSLFVTVIWAILLLWALLPAFKQSVLALYAAVVGAAVAAVALILWLGRTGQKDRVGVAELRKSTLDES